MLPNDTCRVAGFDFTFDTDNNLLPSRINTDQVNMIGVVIGEAQLLVSTLNEYLPVEDFLPFPALSASVAPVAAVVDGSVIVITCSVVDFKTHFQNL